MMKRLFLILLLAASAMSLDARKLTILHMNDTHSHIEPERTGSRKGHGGVIEQAAVIDSVRAAEGKRNVLLLHGGDFSQGTSYFSELHGDLEISVLNAMVFDCICLGNHEFDNGTQELCRRLSSLKVPVVCSNYNFKSNELGNNVKPYIVVRQAGLKIGFVGVLTDLTYVVDRSVADTFTYLDPAESASRNASILRNEHKCDLVICLSHCGWEEDVANAPRMHDVDIIVGGHSHTFIDEPEVIKGADGRDIIIVQDGKYGLELGQLEIEL